MYVFRFGRFCLSIFSFKREICLGRVFEEQHGSHAVCDIQRQQLKLVQQCLRSISARIKLQGKKEEERWLLLRRTGRRNDQSSLREPRTFSTMSYWVMWNLFFQRWPPKVKVKVWYQLTSFCLHSAVLCSLSRSMVKWQRLKALFNCPTVTTRVCWSYLVSHAAAK